VWEAKDWILAATVSIVTLLADRGWPMLQWLITYRSKVSTDHKTEEEQREDRISKMRIEGYEQVIVRLDKHVGTLEEKVSNLELERLKCVQENAAMREQIKGLEEDISSLMAWKRSRGGSDSKPVTPQQIG